MSSSRRLPLAMRPEGRAGRVFGVGMEWLNGRAYRRALDALAPRPAERFLEIGFGTGRFAELLLASAPEVQVSGVDPADTMVEVANGRRGVRAAGPRADLRLGDDTHLPWPPGSFDGVVALHSFQFWADPAHTLADVHRVLDPAGRLVVVLRDHSGSAPSWLPNPVSRSGDEPERLKQLLVARGFDVETPGVDLIVARPRRPAAGDEAEPGADDAMGARRT